ncbi:hypothetical protein BV22DRAFT_1049076 [Leucogyrophana mollusca]|uniref:Uncharacterized protein n=1 Tax=Leucogyrophana mollusca TaxID=85980 RepID=A0ACB8BB76_9AGAM|nr:hypothetical protein BV22DRAFT_1049076 [Leucogyrophana mollusca]
MSAATVSLAALEIGAILTTFFFGVATVQTRGQPAEVFIRPTDLYLQGVVLWCIQLAQLLAFTTGLYSIITRQFGSMSWETRPQPSGFAWSVLFGGILPLAAQGFFVYRVRVFSRKIWLPVFCGTLCVLCFLLDIGAGIYVIKVPVSVTEFGQRESWGGHGGAYN